MDPAHSVSNAHPEGTLHSIGDAAEAAGLTPQALRMWETRYGRPRAVRLPSGHRRYTDDQVRWLRRVADALAQGHRPGAVVGLDDDALTELLAQALPEVRMGKGPRLILDWIRFYGAAEIRAWLEARWNPDDYLTYLEDEIAPLLVAVGRGWADGELDVRHEHFLSEILEDELRRRRQEYRPSAGAPCLVFATLPGELHALGLHIAALGAAAHGLHVRLLGVNTPVESIVRTATEVRAAAVVISVSASSGGASTDRTLVELRKELAPVTRLIAGGMGMKRVRRSPKGVETVVGLAAWDEILRTLARSPSPDP